MPDIADIKIDVDVRLWTLEMDLTTAMGTGTDLEY
jgi:hypothetical protein